MAEQSSFDLVVIGGGPGGYVGAIRAAQLGLSVACVERDRLGGVCLNWGCIPTKALLEGAALFHRMRHEAADWGIEADNVRHNWEKVISRSRGIADQLNKGIHALFKKHKITHFQGHAFIPRKGVVEVYQSDDTQHRGQPSHALEARHILIATGGMPRTLPGIEFDGERIIAAKEAMTLTEQPRKLLIVGAGAIGMEFAYFYNAFGTEVTVVEMMDRVLPVEDAEVSKAVRRAFKKTGITIHTASKATALEKTDTGIKATIEPVDANEGTGSASAAEPVTIEADKVLLAIGVRARTDGLFDESLGLEIHKDHIKADTEQGTYRTSVEGIHAVGDVIGPPWLAHVASEEAIVCVERLAGHKATDIDYNSIPSCTYCEPQVASIGLTEEQLQEQGIEYNVGNFPFKASGKAQAMNSTYGFCKILTGKDHGEILAAHMVGPNVTEMIAELGLARRLEATAEEIIATIHAHPTLSEATHEAALGTHGRMIHF